MAAVAAMAFSVESTINVYICVLNMYCPHRVVCLDRENGPWRVEIQDGGGGLVTFHWHRVVHADGKGVGGASGNATGLPDKLITKKVIFY